MSNKILINAVDSEECRIARVKDSHLEEFHIESAAKEVDPRQYLQRHHHPYRTQPAGGIYQLWGRAARVFCKKMKFTATTSRTTPPAAVPFRISSNAVRKLMVQVTKDPIMKKGAMLTTYISLPGRYTVLMPGGKTRGISRKIEDEAERSRFKGDCQQTQTA